MIRYVLVLVSLFSFSTFATDRGECLGGTPVSGVNRDRVQIYVTRGGGEKYYDCDFAFTCPCVPTTALDREGLRSYLDSFDPLQLIEVPLLPDNRTVCYQARLMAPKGAIRGGIVWLQRGEGHL